MEDLDYGRFERAICDGVQFAAADPERLKRERNYQLLAAAANIIMNHDKFGISLTKEAAVDKAMALLAEIEGRSK